VVNIGQFNSENYAHCLAIDATERNHGSSQNQQIRRISAIYAEHCLELVRIATDRESRVIQREMAAEWFKLADMFTASEQPAE
jgi:hypothetical protein